MSKPTTKNQLLTEMEHEHNALEQALAGLSSEQLEQPGVVGPWSIKDVIAHLHEWIRMCLGWYAAGVKGESPAIPAEGYNWRQLPQLNQAIYERYREHALSEIMDQFKESHIRISRLVEGLAEEELFSAAKYAWTGKHALVTFIAANTSEHYRWARQEIRKGLKSRKST